MIRVVLLGIVSLFLFACGQSEDKQQASWLPPQGVKGDQAQGQKQFARLCSKCHGYQAAGSEKGPPLVHKIYSPDHHADLAFYMAAKNGASSHHWKFGDMPPVPAATPENMLDIVAYVRHLQSKAGIF